MTHPYTPTRFELAEDKFKFVDQNRSAACLNGLQKLYDNGALCDVILHVYEREFPCHRVVLAAASEYFHTMFTGNFVERTSSKISMNEMDAACLEAVLDYLYKGVVSMKKVDI